MINIIPKPNKISEKEGFLTLKKSLKINKLEKTSKAVLILKKFFDVEEDDNSFDIEFIENYGNKLDGSYKLEIDNQIKIFSSNEAGFLYAVESLRQLLPVELENNKKFNEVKIQKCVIEDYPRYSYRGFMLDSCRHFFKKEFVMKKLDEMAMLKLNKFHFHLSDDQGWRIDLPDFPKLKEIGSVRARTKIDGMNGMSKYDIYEEKPYSGIYSIKDLKEIISYAQSLCIDVIPEIDSPGHLSAFLAAYPEYSCKGHNVKVVEAGGIFENLLCIGNDKGVSFFFKIIDEIAEIFPSKHFHIGGDEAPLKPLKNCEKCQKKMKDLGLKSVLDLKLDYSNKLASHLMEKGYKVTGWNEIINPGYPKDAYIQLWAPMNTRKAIDFVNNGQKVIDSTFFNFYLDYAYSLNPLKRSYSHNPSDLFKKGAEKNIVGVESPLWTEWIRDEDRANWQIYPRLCSTAETGWTENQNKDFDSFLNRVASFNNRLDVLGTLHTTENCYLHAKKKSTIAYFLSKHLPSNEEYNKYRNK